MQDAGLKWLFLDMNAYFASVEQQEQRRLRGRPVAVVPVEAETTCCIAASYEAKRQGVRTGTKVAEARRLCRGLQVVQARPELYVQYHKAIVAAVDSVLPVERVYSIDEMACSLTHRRREPRQAVDLAHQIKEVLAERVGRYLPCSIGIAPNRLLAKVAGEMQKPDGLTVIRLDELPHKLHQLELSDLPGIGSRMLARLHREGITSVAQLCALPKESLAGIWQSVIGRNWWHWLRGDDLPEPPTRRRTVGHSHVLSPQMRTHHGARAVLVKLIHKAATRLRRLGYAAGKLEIQLGYFSPHKSWRKSASLVQCRDTQTMLEAFRQLWENRPLRIAPSRVSVTLYKLTAPQSIVAPLFPEEQRRLQLAETMDAINVRFGASSVHFAAMQEARAAAPMRISFTSIPDLMSERD